MRCLAGADTGRNASHRLDGSAASDAAVAAEAWLVAGRVGADVATFWSSVSEIGSDGAERLNCSLTCGVGVMAGPSHLARPMAEHRANRKQSYNNRSGFFCIKRALENIFVLCDACKLSSGSVGGCVTRVCDCKKGSKNNATTRAQKPAPIIALDCSTSSYM